MTPERFRACMHTIGFSNGQFAKLLGRADDRRVRRWASGERAVPAEVAEWIEGAARYFTAHPPPQMRGAAREEDC
jgi:DNA-binding transcriptional regulator YdaS (Cro superfamily)